MKKNRIISYITAVCLLFATVVPTTAMAELTKNKEEIKIIYTNDIHTYIDNDKGWDYARVKKLKDDLENQIGSNNVLVVDAGDHIQGTAYGDMDKGASIVNLMQAVGYDVATPGNHEFDYGMDRALDVLKGSGAVAIPYISSNFYKIDKGNREANVLDRYRLFEVKLNNCEKKVAFIGVTTPETISSTTPKYFQNQQGEYIYGFSGGLDGKELYVDVQKAIDDAKNEGADYIVGLGHLGVDESSAPWRSTDVISNTSGFTAFIDGHSHTTIESKIINDKTGKGVVLTQTGSYFDNVGVLTIGSNVVKAELLDEEDAKSIQQDETVLNIQKNWMDEVNGELGKVIGYTEVELDNYDQEGIRLVRKQETNTGDFVTDALYYVFDKKLALDVDVAIMNGGGIRNEGIIGNISYKTCKEIHTFGNVACLREVSGQQILDALEWGAKDVNIDGKAESGGFLQVSGLIYEIHPYIESTVQEDSNGIWIGGPTGEYRVKNVKVYDKNSEEFVELDLTKKYNLAGYNYTLCDLGDGFAMFDEATTIVDYVMEDYMILAEYVKKFPKGANEVPTITADNSPYENIYGEGRIEIVSKAKMDEGVGVNTDEDEKNTTKSKSPDTGEKDILKIWIYLLIISCGCINVINIRKRID